MAEFMGREYARSTGGKLLVCVSEDHDLPLVPILHCWDGERGRARVFPSRRAPHNGEAVVFHDVDDLLVELAEVERLCVDHGYHVDFAPPGDVQATIDRLVAEWAREAEGLTVPAESRGFDHRDARFGVKVAMEEAL